MTRKNILIALGIIAVLGAVVAANLYYQQDTGPSVTVEAIKTRDLEAIVSASGKIQPKRLVNIQTKDGRPLAILSAYSLHYVGSPAISADYFAIFCDKLAGRVGFQPAKESGAAGETPAPQFMAALANATSGDTWLMDYTQKERRKYDREEVAEDVATEEFEE